MPENGKYDPTCLERQKYEIKRLFREYYEIALLWNTSYANRPYRQNFPEGFEKIADMLEAALPMFHFPEDRPTEERMFLGAGYSWFATIPKEYIKSTEETRKVDELEKLLQAA